MPLHARTLFCLIALLATASSHAAPIAASSRSAPKPSVKQPSVKQPSKQVLALFDAAEQGNTLKVKALLDSGVSAKAQAPNGLTPLILACMKNHPATVKLLLDRGADPNAALVPGGYIGGSTPLIMAADASMNILAGAKTPPSPPGYDGHEIEFMQKHPDRVREWDRQMEAWAKGYDVIVRMLVEHGADVNAQTTVGMSAIAAASNAGDLETVKLLLDKGARLDLPTHETDLLSGKPLEGTTGYEALAGATTQRQHNPELIKLLLAHGAKPNATSTNDMTPLGRAAESGDAEVVSLLLAAGANVNAYDPFGHTALMLAERNKNPAVISLLRQAGAKDLPDGPHTEVTLKNLGREVNGDTRMQVTVTPHRGGETAGKK